MLKIKILGISPQFSIFLLQSPPKQLSLEGVFKISVQMVFLNFSTTKRHIYMPLFLLKTYIKFCPELNLQKQI